MDEARQGSMQRGAKVKPTAAPRGIDQAGGIPTTTPPSSCAPAARPVSAHTHLWTQPRSVDLRELAPAVSRRSKPGPRADTRLAPSKIGLSGRVEAGSPCLPQHGGSVAPRRPGSPRQAIELRAGGNPGIRPMPPPIDPMMIGRPGRPGVADFRAPGPWSAKPIDFFFSVFDIFNIQI